MSKISPRIKSSTTSSTKELLSAEKLPNSILVLCPDQTRRQRAVEALIKKFAKDNNANHEQVSKSVVKFHSGDLSLNDIGTVRDSIQNLSLFASVKVTLFKEIEEVGAKLTDTIIELSNSDLGSSLLIFSGSKLPISSKIFKNFTVKKAALIIDTPSSEDAVKWASKESKLLGLNLPLETCRALVTLSETESLISERAVIDILHGFLTKLGLYVESGSVTPEALKDIFPESFTASEYDFIDSALLGNLAKSEILLSTLFQNDKNPFLLLSMLSRSVSNILLIRYL